LEARGWKLDARSWRLEVVRLVTSSAERSGAYREVVGIEVRDYRLEVRDWKRGLIYTMMKEMSKGLFNYFRM
jgi:hypothetical protein